MEELSEDVRHFRLVTGEDIIAQVLLEEKGTVTLGYPMKVIFLPTKDGAYRISLMEWVFSRISPDQMFPVRDRDIVTTSHPSEIITDYYWEALNVLEEKRKLLTKNDRIHDETREIEEFLDDLEEQVESEEASDLIKNLLNSLTGNTKGTLH